MSVRILLRRTASYQCPPARDVVVAVVRRLRIVGSAGIGLDGTVKECGLPIVRELWRYLDLARSNQRVRSFVRSPKGRADDETGGPTCL
jgi:hypothetical protein